MIFIFFLFLVAALQTGSEEVRRVRTNLAAKQIERIAVPEVYVALNDLQRNTAQFAHVAVFAFAHQLSGAFHYSTNPSLADEHVMRFFSQHELAGARQRLEP